MDVQIVLFEGFDELDAIGPYEVFANGARALDGRTGDGDLAVSLRTLEPTEQVRGSHGLQVEPDGVLGEPDVLVVPGGGWNDRAEAGARAEAERGVLPDAVADRHAAGTTVAAVCTGGMILASAGVLDGRPAVTHRGALEELRATAADVVEARVVDAGPVLTAGGVTAGLDLALYLLERAFGDEVADRVADGMEYERRGDVHRG